MLFCIIQSLQSSQRNDNGEMFQYRLCTQTRLTVCVHSPITYLGTVSSYSLTTWTWRKYSLFQCCIRYTLYIHIHQSLSIMIISKCITLLIIYFFAKGTYNPLRGGWSHWKSLLARLTLPTPIYFVHVLLIIIPFKQKASQPQRHGHTHSVCAFFVCSEQCQHHHNPLATNSTVVSNIIQHSTNSKGSGCANSSQ